MVTHFVAWANCLIRANRFKIADAHITLSESSADPSARVDFDADAVVARITMWQSGNFHAEAIDINTEQVVFEESGMSTSEPQQLAACLDKIVCSIVDVAMPSRRK